MQRTMHLIDELKAVCFSLLCGVLLNPEVRKVGVCECSVLLTVGVTVVGKVRAM